MPLPNDCLLFGFEPKLTNEQRIYVDSIFDKSLTFVNAPSGSGKTTLAVACAKLLGKDLIYIFAPVEEKKMGFRPGNQQEKEMEYLQPLKDALLEIGEEPERVIHSENNIDNQKNGTVWVYPKSHIFARGTNIKDCVVIISESQNFTRGELKKILTRIHDTCTVIVEGHTGQCDLPDPSKSGFNAYIEHFTGEDYVSVCELSRNFRGRISRKADELQW
ncbi:PhoH family protein [Cytobacillus kochii]|uniref:PhoH family protein n=1 Tax=Cytobacillus kochii TaxID=859143 RepID=UPI001CD286E2|nr:PhoH family protein [Cytobacillus kochii]MCA1025688.1 PhoH family protein [Cytobacillus kochii]